MGQGKKKQKAKWLKKLHQRNSIRKKMGKPIFFTLTYCNKKLKGVSNQYLYKANMHKLFFTGTRFYNVKYQSSIITNCKFKGTELIGVDFFNCNMRNVSFKNAKLNNVVFYNCNLKSSDFSGATFSHVSFICTNVNVATGLNILDDGITVYKTYRHINLEPNTESTLLNLASIPSIYNANVLHVNKNKLNHWTLALIEEKYGTRGIDYLSKKLSKKETWNNMFTVYSYTLLLDNYLPK